MVRFTPGLVLTSVGLIGLLIILIAWILIQGRRAQGPEGLVGLLGPQGSKGPAGLPNVAFGATGPSGMQGQSGPQGPMGPIGPFGLGAYWSSAFVNYVPMNASFEPSVSFTEASGYNSGPSSSSGPSQNAYDVTFTLGQAWPLNSLVATSKSSKLASNSLAVTTVPNSDASEYTTTFAFDLVIGPSGPTGPSGLQGPSGNPVTGPNGTQGLQGPIGTTGATGASLNALYSEANQFLMTQLNNDTNALEIRPVDVPPNRSISFGNTALTVNNAINVNRLWSHGRNQSIDNNIRPSTSLMSSYSGSFVGPATNHDIEFFRFPLNVVCYFIVSIMEDTDDFCHFHGIVHYRQTGLQQIKILYGSADSGAGSNQDGGTTGGNSTFGGSNPPAITYPINTGPPGTTQGLIATNIKANCTYKWDLLCSAFLPFTSTTYAAI